MIRTILFRLGIALAAFAVLWFLTGSAIVTLVLGGLIAALIWVPHHLHGDGRARGWGRACRASIETGPRSNATRHSGAARPTTMLR